MNNMNLLFCEFPEIHSLVVELISYSTLIVIPNETIQLNLNLNNTTMDLHYPNLLVVMEALILVRQALQTCSSTFILSMMKKHRLVRKPYFKKFSTIIKNVYLRILFHLIGSYYHVSQLNQLHKTPHHRRGPNQLEALHFFKQIQESDPLVTGNTRIIY